VSGADACHHTRDTGVLPELSRFRSLQRRARLQKSTVFLSQESTDDLFPLGFQGTAILGSSCPRIPIARIRNVTLAAMQIGVDPGGIGRIVILRDTMGGLPVVLRIVPHRAQRRRQPGRFAPAFPKFIKSHETSFARSGDSERIFSEEIADDVLDGDLGHREVRHRGPVEQDAANLGDARAGNFNLYAIRRPFQN
jgi:hypothetical protein